MIDFKFQSASPYINISHEQIFNVFNDPRITTDNINNWFDIYDLNGIVSNQRHFKLLLINKVIVTLHEERVDQLIYKFNCSNSIDSVNAFQNIKNGNKLDCIVINNIDNQIYNLQNIWGSLLAGAQYIPIITIDTISDHQLKDLLNIPEKFDIIDGFIVSKISRTKLIDLSDCTNIVQCKQLVSDYINNQLKEQSIKYSDDEIENCANIFLKAIDKNCLQLNTEQDNFSKKNKNWSRHFKILCGKSGESIIDITTNSTSPTIWKIKYSGFNTVPFSTGINQTNVKQIVNLIKTLRTTEISDVFDLINNTLKNCKVKNSDINLIYSTFNDLSRDVNLENISVSEYQNLYKIHYKNFDVAINVDMFGQCLFECQINDINIGSINIIPKTVDDITNNISQIIKQFNKDYSIKPLIKLCNK